MSDCCQPSLPTDMPPAVAGATLPSFDLRPGVTFPDWSVVTSSVVLDALRAMVSSGHVLNRWSAYDSVIDRVRTALLQLYSENGRAPGLAVLAMRTGVTETALVPMLEELRRRDLAVLEHGQVVGAYPFTNRDSGHRVYLDSQVVNAMCAVDALGIGAMCDRDITIISDCRHCGAPISVATEEHGRRLAHVKPVSTAVWLSVQYENACAANSLCTATAFFCSNDHLIAWRRKHQPEQPGFQLSIGEALQAGRAIFGPSFAGIGTLERTESRSAKATGDASAIRSGPATARPHVTDRKDSYELAVIGAGSAGFSAAITAAAEGARVALVGHGSMGGTCTNVGCVPSKTLIRAAETLHNARVAARFAGVRAQGEVTDWGAAVRQKDELVAELRQAKYVDLLPSYSSIHYREGAARLTETGVEVDGTKIHAGKVIIATGTRPAIPAIPGIDSVPYLTSTAALDLKTLPQSLLVIGGGYIGAELAQLFARAGVKVTIVCRSRLLPAVEPEISTALTRYFSDEGIEVVSGVAYYAIRKNDNGIALTVVRDGQELKLEADEVLVAAGRMPNIEALGLKEARITSTANGIVVDDRMRTSRSGIYAAGDVTGHDQFVYMAAYGAKVAAKNALNGDSLRYDNRSMPAVVFTDPHVASVGLTEAAARAAGHDVRVSTIGLDQVPRALVARDTRGLIKLVAEAGSNRLLGAHILAPEGADSIQTAVLAIRHRLTTHDLAETIFPYLTTVEGLKLAALSFEKDVTKLSCCAG